MTKQTTNKIEQIDNLPALPIDPVIVGELENPEGVLQLDDFAVKCKPKERNFQVSYDGENWETVDALPDFVLVSSAVYWSHYDGQKYHTKPLDDPPDENDSRKWDKSGKLSLFHPKYGQGAFLLAPSGLLAFKGFLQMENPGN